MPSCFFLCQYEQKSINFVDLLKEAVFGFIDFFSVFYFPFFYFIFLTSFYLVKFHMFFFFLCLRLETSIIHLNVEECSSFLREALNDINFLLAPF